MKKLADSSIWLEFFAGTDRGAHFKDILSEPDLIVPSVVIYEVFKKLYSQKGETLAVTALMHMQQKRVIELDEHLAVLAAKVSAEEKLPMADSLIYATALLHDATVWTQDADFKNLAQVEYFEKSLSP